MRVALLHLCLLMATNNVYDDESIECPICFEGFKKGSTLHLPCRHKFCFDCALQMQTTNCPTCRRSITNLKLEDFRKSVVALKGSVKRIESALWSKVAIRKLCFSAGVFVVGNAMLSGCPLQRIALGILIFGGAFKLVDKTMIDVTSSMIRRSKGIQDKIGSKLKLD